MKVRRFLRQQSVALLALFVALGGTSIAASNALLPNNSVGTKQLRNGAVTKTKINAKTLKALKGNRGLQGAKGDKGADFTIATTLQPGQTEVGVYSAWGQDATGEISDTVNFRVPLPADLPTGHQVFVPQGTTSATHCPGIGHANSGYLCIYEDDHVGATEVGAFDPSNGHDDISKLGFGVNFVFATASGGWSYGSWAVSP
jgi:hypothetical protein